MKSKMNRALSMLLLLVMVLTVFPVMTSTATAAESEAQDVAIYTYEDLYVTDGLVAWFDAFGANNATVDLENGVWTAKYGDTTATIKGTTWWKFRANGGFGYDMTQAELDAHWAETEVVFDINLLNETVFTFETFLTPYGPVDEEGNRSITSSGWGNYNGASTFINVGNLRTLQFGNHTTYSLFETRFVYTENADGWNSNQGAGSGITNNNTQIRHLAGPGLPVGLTFVYNHTVATVEIPAEEEGGEPTLKDIHTALYDCYENGKRFLLYNSQTTAVGNQTRDNDGDGENDYYWQKLYYPVLPKGSLKIAGAFPSTVYSARLYDRALTAWELAQNHAADILGLTGADLSPIKDENALNLLVAALATVDGSATKASVEAVIAKIAADLAASKASSLYVTDGLLFWLDGSDASTVDLAGGKWTSKIGGVVATLKGSWKAGTENAGLGYRFDLASPTSDSGLDLPVSLVTENFTLDMWAISRGLTVGADGVTPAIADGQYGGGQSTSIVIGFLVADSFAAERTPGHQYYNNNCSFNELAWYPAEKVTGGSLWSSEAGKFGWGQRDTSFRYDGNALSYTVIKDGRAVKTHDNATVKKSFTLPKEIAVTGDHMFYLFRGFPVELYSVRYYNRVLSTAEIAWNHLADLVAYTGVSVASVLALSDAAHTDLALAYAGQDFVPDKAALKAQLEADIAARAVLGKTTVYDDLYVKEGLVQLLSAFGTDYGTIDPAKGIWYSKVGVNYATVKGGLYNAETNAFGWKARENGGIGYDLTDEEMIGGKGNGSWIDLGANIVDSLGDYTLEYAAATPVVTDKATPGGYNLDKMTEKFGHWGTWNLNGNVRVLYHMHGYEGNHNNGYGCQNWGEVNYSLSSDAKTYTNVIDNTPDTSYRTVVRDGVRYKVYEHVGRSEAAGGNVMTKLEDPCQVFFILRNTTNTVYSVRMYDRVLTEDEILLNHFADLCAYTGAALGNYASYTDYEKIHVATQFAGTALNKADKAALEAAIASAAGLSEAAENVYDELYVKDGLAALFTAYNGADSVSLPHGIWASKVGLSHIRLADNSSAASWTAGEKGVGYTFASMADLTGNLNKIGMYLPIDVMQDGNMAVEYVFNVNAPMKDGVQEQATRTEIGRNDKDEPIYEYSVGGNYPWGIYNASPVSTFSFGGLNVCQFHWTAWDSGASCSSRFYYGQGSWENFGGDAGKARTFTYTNVIGTYKDGYDTDMMTLSFNRTLSNPADAAYTNVQFDLYKNGSGFGKVVNTGDLGSDNQRRFWSLEQLQQQDGSYTPFHAFFALPATVYSIRMYNKTLTEAERAQNHAVDLMAYFKMDVTGFAAASEEAKARVYEAFAGKTFEASALEVAVMQAAIDRAVEEAIVGVVVSQKSSDGTALRIVGALETMENVSRVGFVITFKKNGEVVKTFGEATADNRNTTTQTVFESVTASGIPYSADALCTEYLYAAVVKGVPAGTYTVEVTPFAVDMGGNVVTGETKSQTVTF